MFKEDEGLKQLVFGVILIILSIFLVAAGIRLWRK